MYDVTGSVQHVFEHSKCCICDKNMYSYQDCELVTSSTFVMAAHSECVMEATPAEEDGDDEDEDEEEE